MGPRRRCGGLGTWGEPKLRGLADILESDRFGHQLKKDLLREAFDRIIIERDATVKLWVRL